MVFLTHGSLAQRLTSNSLRSFYILRTENTTMCHHAQLCTVLGTEPGASWVRQALYPQSFSPTRHSMCSAESVWELVWLQPLSRFLPSPTFLFIILLLVFNMMGWCHPQESIWKKWTSSRKTLSKSYANRLWFQPEVRYLRYCGMAVK